MTQTEALEVLKTGANVFLTGEPGSGKTYTINQYCKWLSDQYKNVAITASTGIAATHINGKTIHSWSGIGIKERITDLDIKRLMERSYVVRQILQADVLVIDEISMLNGQTLNNIDRILRHVRSTALEGIAFGGLQVVFVGDFFQLPPVTKGRAVAHFAFESDAWQEAAPEVCYLTEQHRQSDPKFLEILTAMRNGKVQKHHHDTLMSQEDKLEEEAITKLFTHNADVDALNEEELEKLETDEHVYHMETSGQEFLIETLKKNCLSPDVLTLKEGALVMFTRNNFDEGYVNGTQGIVVGYNGRYPVVHTHDGLEITAKPAEWSIKHNDGHEAAKITQIPLRLAWAITVHKSQGMSLDSAIVDLSQAFEFGQGYVAISRVRSLAGLSLTGINAQAFRMHPKVVKMDAEFRRQSEETREKHNFKN